VPDAGRNRTRLAHRGRVSAADRKPVVVRVGELEDAVAAVPYLLGFQPSDSIVGVALTGRRERMSFTMRLDLVSDEYDDELAEMFAARMAHARAKAVMLFVYTRAPLLDRDEEMALPRQPLVEAVADALAMPLREAVLVANGRAWSYLCRDSRCCPPEGRLLDPTSPGALGLAAAHALRGRAVMPDRDSVVASVAPLGGITAASMRQAIGRAGTQAEAIGDSSFADLVMQEQLPALVERYREPPAALSHDEAAALIVALFTVGFRDHVIEVFQRDGEPVRLLLHDLVRFAVPPVDAPACTCLAWAAYSDGDGLIAAAALDRALASDPDYHLATLLATALQSQVHPRELRAAVWATSERD